MTEESTTDDFLQNLTESISTPNDNSAALKARWPYFFFVLLILTALFLNGVVITSVFFYGKLHGLFYYGIASLSAGHTFYMVLVAPFLIARSILEAFPFESNWCQTWATLDSIITAASNIHFCVLAYILQIMFVNPLKYKLWHNRNSVFKLIGGSWLLSILLAVPSIVFWLRSVQVPKDPTDLPLQDFFECGILESVYIYSQVVPCYLVGTICFLGLFYRLLLGIKYQSMLARNLQSPGGKPVGTPNGKGPRKHKRLTSNSETSENSSRQYSLNRGIVNNKSNSDQEIGDVIVHVQDSNTADRIDIDHATDSGRSSMYEEAGVIPELVNQNHIDIQKTEATFQTCNCDKPVNIGEDDKIIHSFEGRPATNDAAGPVCSSNHDGSQAQIYNTETPKTSENDDGTVHHFHMDTPIINSTCETTSVEKPEENKITFEMKNVTPVPAGEISDGNCIRDHDECDDENQKHDFLHCANHTCVKSPYFHETSFENSKCEKSLATNGQKDNQKDKNCRTSRSQTCKEQISHEADNVTICETLSNHLISQEHQIEESHTIQGIDNPSFISDDENVAQLDQSHEGETETQSSNLSEAKMDQSQEHSPQSSTTIDSTKHSQVDETLSEGLPLSEKIDQECTINSRIPSILKTSNKEIELERVCSTKSVSFANNVKKTTSSTKSNGKNLGSKSPGQRPKSQGPNHAKPRPPNRPALKLVNANDYMKKVNKEQGLKLMTRISDNKSTVLMLLVMYILYLGLTLPYHMYHVVVAVNRQTNKLEPITENSKDTLSLLQWIATCATFVNPIIYWLFSEHFRKGYHESYISCCDRDQKYYRERQKRFGMFKEN